MRVADVVAFESGTRTKFDRELARTTLARCGLVDKAWVARLSRGQRAQLALVMAVASQPDVMVLDDPALLRFGRFPMPAARRIGWTVAVGLGGVAVYVCARSIESARAWRRVPR
jgi:hypothetical protein